MGRTLEEATKIAVETIIDRLNEVIEEINEERLTND